MAVVESNDELLEDPARLLLRQSVPRLPHEEFEEVAPLCTLHHNCQVRMSQEHLQAHLNFKQRLAAGVFRHGVLLQLQLQSAGQACLVPSSPILYAAQSEQACWLRPSSSVYS